MTRRFFLTALAGIFASTCGGRKGRTLEPGEAVFFGPTWAVTFSRPPCRLYDPYVREVSWVSEPGNEATVRFRGHVYCVVPLTVAGARTVHHTQSVESIRLLLSAPNHRWAEYFYFSHGWAKRAADLAVELAREQKHMDGWPRDVTEAFFADPVGRVLYDRWKISFRENPKV